MDWRNCVNEVLLWDKGLNVFQPIIPIKDMRVYDKRCINPEQLDLNGIPIRFSYIKLTRNIETQNNDTEITGLFGDTWNLVRDYLNFTTVLLKVGDPAHGHISRDIAESIMFNWIKLNITDIAVPMSKSRQDSALYSYISRLTSTCYKLHIPPAYKSDDTWLFRMTTSNVLLIILAIMIIMSFMSILIDKYRFPNKNGKDNPIPLNDHFFYTFATFVNQDSSPLTSVENRSRILTITKRMLAFLFMVMSTANLFYLMSKKQIDVPFSDLSSFFAKSNMKLVIRATAPGWTDVLSTVPPALTCHRVELVDAIDDMYKIASQQNAAIWQSEYSHRSNGYKFINNFAPIGTCTARRGFGIHAISKIFHYRRAIIIGMLKIQESGLFDIVKQHWLLPTVSFEPEQYQNINLEQMKILLIIYLIGVMMSLVILIIEKTVKIRERQRLRKNWDRQLRRAAQRINIS